MRRSILLLPSCFLLACTQDFDIFEPDGGSVADATTDTQTSDAGSDGSKGDAGDAAPFDAGGDAAPFDAGSLVFACGNTTVASCSQCNGFPEPCVYCQQNNAANLAGRCTTMGSSCFQAGAPNGYQLCQCTNASMCPESYQVCRNQTCRTCSDSFNNNGQSCKSGGTCNNVDGGCL